MKLRSKPVRTPIREIRRHLKTRDVRKADQTTALMTGTTETIGIGPATEVPVRTTVREKAVRILEMVRVIGVITMVVRTIAAALTIRTAVADQMQGRVINSEADRQRKALQWKLRQRMLRSTEKMKSAASVIRTKTNAPKRI